MSSLPLSPTLLADSLYERIGTNGRAFCTLSLVFAENAGSSQQGHACMMTETQYDPTYGCNGLCRLLSGAVPTRGRNGGRSFIRRSQLPVKRRTSPERWASRWPPSIRSFPSTIGREWRASRHLGKVDGVTSTSRWNKSVLSSSRSWPEERW